MEATDILRHEHRAIESVLDSLDKAADAVKAGRQVPAWIFADGIDFIRNFADRCHHHKEEGRLFPKFAERGLSADSGPIAVMLIEHEQGRQHVRDAAAQFGNWTKGDAAAGDIMANELKAYIRLLREHIYKEDNILYPMGDQHISKDDDHQLVEEFDSVEEEEMGPGVHEKYHAMIDALEKAARALEQEPG